LAIPVFRVVKLKINTRQKLALIGVFAIGTLVAIIEIVRGVLVLMSLSSLDSVPSNIIMITVQCTLAITVTNLPILRPLLFTRSFGSQSGSSHANSRTGASGGRSWVQRSGHKGSIPLYDYGNHVQVSAGPRAPTLHNPFDNYGNGIMKSVEVRVESSSVISSDGSTRKGSKFSDPI
jgi:hypothetical protein